MRVLVDSSVWIGHFKRPNEQLVVLLNAGLAVCHPHVIVEIACGTPPSRRTVLEMLSLLESAPVATHGELLALIERHGLAGRGCGCVDVGLLASTLLGNGMLLWTLDKRLEGVARDLGRCYQPSH